MLKESSDQLRPGVKISDAAFVFQRINHGSEIIEPFIERRSQPHSPLGMRNDSPDLFRRVVREHPINLLPVTKA